MNLLLMTKIAYTSAATTDEGQATDPYEAMMDDCWTSVTESNWAGDTGLTGHTIVV